MKHEMTLDQMELEMTADKDVRAFISALQELFDEASSRGESSNKQLSSRLGMDPSYLSRMINGRSPNPNLKTIAKIFRALNARLTPKVEMLGDISSCQQNYVGSQAYDDACWRIELHNFWHERMGAGHLTEKHVAFMPHAPQTQWKQIVDTKELVAKLGSKKPCAVSAPAAFNEIEHASW